MVREEVIRRARLRESVRNRTRTGRLGPGQRPSLEFEPQAELAGAVAAVLRSLHALDDAE
jgi:hypothetical protein